MIDETNGNLKFEPVLEDNTELQNNKKSKWKFIIGGILLVVAIGIGLFIGYSKITSNPVIIYKNAINGIYNILNDNLEKIDKTAVNIDFSKDSVIGDLNFNLSSSLDELKPFTGIDYGFSVGLDNKNKKAMAQMKINKDNKEMLKVIMSLLNDNAYLKSDTLFDKIIDLGKMDLNVSNYVSLNGNNLNIDYEDLQYILKELKEMIISSLDKDKFEVTDQVITIKNKKYNVKKALYNLDKDNMERTLKFIAKEISNNETLLEKFANLTHESVNAIKDNLKNVKYDGEDIQIVLYADKLGSIIAGLLNVDKKQVLEFDYLDKKINVAVMDDKNKLVIKEENEAVDIIYTEGVKEVCNIKVYNENEKELKIDYIFNVEGMKITGAIYIKDKSNQENSWSGDFKLEFKVDGEEKIDFAVEGDLSIKKAPFDIDVKNSVKVNDISADEYMSIYTKLGDVLKELGLSDFGNLLQGM